MVRLSAAHTWASCEVPRWQAPCARVDRLGHTALPGHTWSPCWCAGRLGSRRDALGHAPTRGGATVTFNEVLSQTIAMLHQHGRVSYRALKRQFAIPDDYLADLTDAILFAYPQVREEEGRGLVWTGDTPLAPRGTAGAERAPAPVAYTPPYLARNEHSCHSRQ